MDFIFIDFEPIGIAIIIGTAVGVFFISRYCLKRWTKSMSSSRLLIGSLLATLLITPLIFGLVAAIQIYSGYREALVENHAELTSSTLGADVEQLMDQMIETEALKGKTKREIVNLLGMTDTTSNKLRYSFLMEQKNKPYILEIQFVNDRVVDYKKKD